MSKIEFEQISENEIEVVIPPETPMNMVQQLTKSFAAKGLVEDLQKSTLSVRYFYRPADKANDIADKLIKSLQDLAKDELPYWHPKSQMANQARNRDVAIADRRAKLGVKQPMNVSTAPEPHIMPAAGVAKPTTPTVTPNVNTSKMFDNTPAARNTANGTGKRYAFINDPVGKGEHLEDCDCEQCQEINKSNYGPKGAGQYSDTDNARRKMGNTGQEAHVGPNVSVKNYTTKPGQLSGKEQANLTSRIQSMANKKQPVKRWSPEEVAEENKKRGFKKSWGQHLPFPSTEEEIRNFANSQRVEAGDESASRQLAEMMNSKAMLNPNHRQPTSEDMIMAGESMGLGVSESMLKSADKQWNSTINNWLVEAQKPISQRFSSEEEEMAYWRNLRVNGGSNEDPSY